MVRKTKHYSSFTDLNPFVLAEEATHLYSWEGQSQWADDLPKEKASIVITIIQSWKMSCQATLYAQIMPLIDRPTSAEEDLYGITHSEHPQL